MIRVLPSSPLNVANFLDISDPGIFPRAFVDGTIGGDYAPQHTSDLIRWPLLLKYGGVYADVGMIQNGNFDRLWQGDGWQSCLAVRSSLVQRGRRQGTQSDKLLSSIWPE
jgi:Glycosyltransferase sugar-binding region containing DXD motif